MEWVTRVARVLSALDPTGLAYRAYEQRLLADLTRERLPKHVAVMADGNSIDMADVYFNVATADAQAAGVELPSLSALLGDDRSLDLVLGAAPAAASTAAPAAVAADSAVAALGQLCNLYEEQQYALISA